MKARGFTLLELLVAVAIFAIMATLAYTGLTALLSSRRVVETHLARLHALQQAYVVMQRDITQAAPRTGTDELGGVLPALRGAPGRSVLALTRAGYPNPGGLRRSHLLRVRYQLDGKKLVRLQWPQIDRAAGDRPQRTVLLDHVKTLRFRYTEADGQALPYWPPAGAAPHSIPRAVRVSLAIHGLNGPVSWLFLLP